MTDGSSVPLKQSGATSVRRRMLRQGGTQAVLLGPSIALSVAALAMFPVDIYAAWGLLFSLGTAAVVLDFGAYQLAQIKRAEGQLSTSELAALFFQAAISPLVLTLLTTLWWQSFSRAFVSENEVADWMLPAILGIGALLRAWQNVMNGIALGADREQVRRRASYASAATQLIGLAVAVLATSVYTLSAAFLAGGLVGIVALVAEVKSSVGEPPSRQGASDIPVRSVISALGLTMTQLDRLVVGLVAAPAGLAAYDFAARCVSTTKLGCVLLATGATAEGARSANSDANGYRETAQRFIDRLAVVTFAITPIGVWLVTIVTSPAVASAALMIAGILVVGNGLNATTAPISGYLSGLRILKPELSYLIIASGLMVILSYVLGVRFAASGVAMAVTSSLLVGSAYFRFYAAPRASLAVESSQPSRGSAPGSPASSP